MALYTVFFANDDGTPATGLSPSFTVLKAADDGANVTPPAVAEVGGGWYRFTHAPAELQVATVDGGDTLTTGRYVPAVLSPNDYDIALVQSGATQTSVDDLPTNAELATALSPLALEASVQDLPTNDELSTALVNLSTQNSVDIINSVVDSIKLKTDNLPNDPASETTIGMRPTLAQIESSSILSKESTLLAVKSIVDNLPDNGELTSLSTFDSNSDSVNVSQIEGSSTIDGFNLIEALNKILRFRYRPAQGSLVDGTIAYLDSNGLVDFTHKYEADGSREVI